MITVRNKKESLDIMKKLRLNIMPTEIFNVNDIEGIKKFVQQNKASEYILRDPIKAKGKFFFADGIEDILKLTKNYQGEVTIEVSYRPHNNDLILVGDIKVHRGYSSDMVDLVARSDINATQRNIYDLPQYNLHTSLEDDKIWDVPGFSKIINYISEHELYDLIVEFLIFDIKIGVNKENVVIAELRSDY